MSGAVCGDRWALLPSAAGFVDPLLSTGFPLTLLGVSRLAEILENYWGSPEFNERLQNYETKTIGELLATSRLISGLYANMGDFPVFAALSLLYFAAASFSESARRLNKPQLASSFLLYDHPIFGPACRELLHRAKHTHSRPESDRLIEDIFCAIELFDVAGLSKRNRRNWYPVDAEDLFAAASKLGSNQSEIASLLDRCGFYPKIASV